MRAGSVSIRDTAQQACSWSSYNTSALTYGCALLARKFPSDTASAAQHLLASCSSSLKITNDGDCDESAEEIMHQRDCGVGAHIGRRMLHVSKDAWLQHLIDQSERGGGEEHAVGRQRPIPAWLEDRT